MSQVHFPVLTSAPNIVSAPSEIYHRERYTPGSRQLACMPRRVGSAPRGGEFGKVKVDIFTNAKSTFGPP